MGKNKIIEIMSHLLQMRHDYYESKDDALLSDQLNSISVEV